MTLKNIQVPTPLTSPCLTLDPAVEEQNLALPDSEEDASSSPAHVGVVGAGAHHLPGPLGELRLAAVALGEKGTVLYTSDLSGYFSPQALNSDLSWKSDKLLLLWQ